MTPDPSIWGGGAEPPEEHAVEFARLIDTLRAAQDLVAGARPPAAVSARVRRNLAEITELLEPFIGPESEQLSGRVMEVPGRAHALLPVLRVDEHDDKHVIGRVTFGRFYLGGNGAVHGGAIPLLFDEVLGRLANTGGRAMSRTAYLHVNYRHITPIEVELRLEARFDREEGRKRFVVGALYNGDTLTADVDGLFIALRPGQP